MKPLFFCVLTTSLLLGACGPTPNIAATVQVAVASTHAAFSPVPSMTFYPTYTPVPPTSTSTNIPPATLPFSLSVPANIRWVATNVWLATGQSIRITAIGKVNLGGGAPEATFGPNGGFGPCRAEDEQDFPCHMIGAKYGALIGRIGENGESFLVGAQSDITASASGQLYLGSNSVSLGDNTGIFTVRIEEP